MFIVFVIFVFKLNQMIEREYVLKFESDFKKCKGFLYLIWGRQKKHRYNQCKRN